MEEPFGQIMCEEDIRLRGERYKDYYYYTRFTATALNQDTYLIVGRRGSGKTSLGHYFKFQNEIENCRYQYVSAAHIFNLMFEHTSISQWIATETSLLTGGIERLWEFVFWNLVFSVYYDEDPAIQRASLFDVRDAAFKTTEFSFGFAKTLVKTLVSEFLVQHSDKVPTKTLELLTVPYMINAKDAVLKITPTNPIIIAIDSLEQYPIQSKSLMHATATLISTAAKFNMDYATLGIHVKVFMTEELFPHIKKEVSNLRKFIKKDLHISWEPDDIIKLICHRFYDYLKMRNLLVYESKRPIDWNDCDDILSKVWDPYFGREIKNGRGQKEKSFPYILRHTQMNPTQVIMLCNEIFARAREKNPGKFPRIDAKTIVEGVQLVEVRLAEDVINAYKEIYPSLDDILSVFRNKKVIFSYNELTNTAEQSRDYWRDNTYSLEKFLELTKNIGLIGRVRKFIEGKDIAEADFYYNKNNEFRIVSGDMCAVHPMFFYQREINVKDCSHCIYPFPHTAAFKTIRDLYEI